jgi:uncharacterized protein (TIGR01777 family)
MNILITGASGLVGSALSRVLQGRGDRVVALLRSHGAMSDRDPCWNPERSQIDLAPARPLDAVVHLAGESIAQRWTAASKARIRRSRVEGTRLLCEALRSLEPKPRVLVSASAVGFYGDRGEEVCDEDSRGGAGFLAGTCQEWESATEPALAAGIRVVHLRIGVVLARAGGALARMMPVFRFGLGGRLGSGRQYMSWITLSDLVRAIAFALDSSVVSGPVNAVAPSAVTNRDFTRGLANQLRRPALLNVPAFVIRGLLGEMGTEVLLASTRVVPGRLQKSGFVFQAGDLASALAAVLT